MRKWRLEADYGDAVIKSEISGGIALIATEIGEIKMWEAGLDVSIYGDNDAMIV